MDAMDASVARGLLDTSTAFNLMEMGAPKALVGVVLRLNHILAVMDARYCCCSGAKTFLEEAPTTSSRSLVEQLSQHVGGNSLYSNAFHLSLYFIEHLANCITGLIKAQVRLELRLDGH